MLSDIILVAILILIRESLSLWFSLWLMYFYSNGPQICKMNFVWIYFKALDLLYENLCILPLFLWGLEINPRSWPMSYKCSASLVKSFINKTNIGCYCCINTHLCVCTCMCKRMCEWGSLVPWHRGEGHRTWFSLPIFMWFPGIEQQMPLPAEPLCWPPGASQAGLTLVILLLLPL